jgi:hypothetical protein
MNIHDRRTFLKGMLTIPAGLLLSDVCSGSSESTTDRDDIFISSNISALSWRKTIFCQFDHHILKAAVEKCAQDIRSFVFNGEPFSPDIYAIGGFVQVLDRNTIGRQEWNDYVAFADEVFDDIPCVVIDSMNNMKLPRTKCVIRVNLDNADSVFSIIRAIKNIRTQMDRNLPKHLMMNDPDDN